MVSAATKRKKKQRGNQVAAAVEEGRFQASAERKALGTEVNAKVPNASLFVEDRGKIEQPQLEQIVQAQASEQRRASRRARRAGAPVRKSEAAIAQNADSMDVCYTGQKKKREKGYVEKNILNRHKFDRPEGHVGNRSEKIREQKKYTDGKEDVWNSEISKQVSGEICENRRKLTQKMHVEQRRAEHVIKPDNGLSINPAHTDHQDKLGEALAKIVEDEDEEKWTEKKLAYDEKLVEGSDGEEIADTGMKVDSSDDEINDELEEEELQMVTGVPERKTRSQRHKEARVKVMQANIMRKKKEEKRKRDYEQIDDVKDDATQEADRLYGIAKKRRLEEVPELPKSADVPVLDKIAGQRVRSEKSAEPIVLSTELGDGIRDVKMPAANAMLRDRFISFERRGLIEPPKVLPKEIWRMDQAKRQEALKDRRKRKGRGSRSNLTFWKNGKKVIQ